MALLQQAPRLSAEAAADLARELYGLDADASPLPSERDQNFLLIPATPAPPGRFVLKIANASEDRALLEAQNAAMRHVAQTLAICPRVVPARDGADLSTFSSKEDGRVHLVRLLTWIDGTPMARVRRRSAALLADLGRCLGELDRALSGFDHPAVHRDFYWDLAGGLRVVADRVAAIQGADLRELVVATAARIERDVAPMLASLRRSVIHNDANDYNVLVGGDGDLFTRDQQVVGLIDFGDMVHGYTCADLAVAIAYAVLDAPHPLDVAVQLVRGYHEVHPLEDAELAALHGLVCLRLCMSAAIAAEQTRERPGDDYLAVSQAPIARTLPRLTAVPWGIAEARFRHACGKLASPKAIRVLGWIREQHAFAPLVDAGPAAALDLRVGSPLIAGDPRDNHDPALTARIDAELRSRGTGVGIGRYGEVLPVEDEAPIHLGLDFYAPAGTAVHAPLDGVVHAVARRPATIILEHQAGPDTFFTLYAGVDAASTARVTPGQPIAAGEAFASICEPYPVGGWPPHLHVQVIPDLFGLGVDFPRLCRADERDVWAALSLDPGAVARLAMLSPPPPSPAETLLTRQVLIGRNVRVGYRNPVKVVRGWMQYLYDSDGRRYLDAYNNVPHVGHCHPRIVQAAASQMRVLNTNTRYLHDRVLEFAERLLATLPDPLRVCYFVNSGSEANELALRLARSATRRRDLIVLDAAYHGNTTTLVSVSPYKFNGPGGEGAPEWVHVVPIPDVYRGPFKRDDPDAGAKYAAFVARAIDGARERGTGIGAFIAESAPSVGGQIILPPGYLDVVYRTVRAAGGVCIADEVQTAYGRLGSPFYAFQAQGVVPDILVLGKPIGNGYPLGAVVTTREIADAFDNGMEFFSTFGGSTVSAAVGLAVLQVVQEERLAEHAARVGGRLLERLRGLVDRVPLVGDVRGSGLFIGVELVKDRTMLEPADEEASYVVNRLRDEGILVGTDGPYANVIKIRPPMPFADEDADLLAERLEHVLEELR